VLVAALVAVAVDGAVTPEAAGETDPAGAVALLAAGVVEGLDPDVGSAVLVEVGEGTEAGCGVVGVGCGAVGAGAQPDAGVPGKELGTCSTSPGWKLADMIPLPAGPSVRPST
jgi:hypothetical protein